MASARDIVGRNDRAAGNSGYSRAGVETIVSSHSRRVARPASVIRYVVRSGRLAARARSTPPR